MYDKFHVLQHANDAVDEVRRAEYFRKGMKMRGRVKGKKWLLRSRWKNLARQQRREWNRLFPLNRRAFKAYRLQESLERLWEYHYQGAMRNCLPRWIDPLRWQRLPALQKLGEMLLKHLEGILNDCRTRVRFGVVEAINANIRMLINRGRGYRNLRDLLLRAQRMVVPNTEYVAFQKVRKAAWNGTSYEFPLRADFVFHPLGVDLRSVFIAFEPLWIKAMKGLKGLSVSGQIGNGG